jgi:stage V sporulation protein D (sporulation-specific penicillin-binding protein)
MNQQTIHHPVWHRRIQFLGALAIVLMAILGYRLFCKQILEYANFLVLAENQYMVKQDVPATRGNIYFSDTFPAATNQRKYQVLAVPRYIKDKEVAAEIIAPLLGQNEADIFSLINNDKYYIPPLKHRLSEEEGQKIADLKIKGVTVMPESVRIYPEGQLASQILGFVDAAGDGHYGLEGYYNNQLKGIGGKIYGEKDTKGNILDASSEVNVRNGSNFTLTLNREVQYQVEQILSSSVEKYQADSGSIIVTDPKTGAILAMANYPSYNGNDFNKVTDQALFNNAATTSNWEPGSIFKPLIMAAAINENKVQPETEEVFPSFVMVNGYKINTSTLKAYGRETMTQVLENSDNVAMVWISELLGKDSMSKYLKDFGFGRKSGIELAGESPGDLADVKKWSDVQRANISFGQGIATTPLQVLVATAAVANDGKLMQPYIVSKSVDFSGKENIIQPKEITQVITIETAKKVTDMMVSVVENGHGKKAQVEGYKVAGKTGTAQVPKPGGGYYEDRHVGSFAGFAPADDPKFAIIVKLDNPKNVDWAESSAAPTFGEVAKFLLNYMSIPPDGGQN